VPATLGADLDHNTDERKSLFVDILFIQLQIPFSFVGESSLSARMLTPSRRWFRGWYRQERGYSKYQPPSSQ